MPCSSSSPLSPNTAAAYYSNSYYTSPASYYFPYTTMPSQSSHHPFMAPLTCPLNNSSVSSPISPPFSHVQHPVAIVPTMNNPSASSSPKDHENIFESSIVGPVSDSVPYWIRLGFLMIERLFSFLFCFFPHLLCVYLTNTKKINVYYGHSNPFCFSLTIFRWNMSKQTIRD